FSGGPRQPSVNTQLCPTRISSSYGGYIDSGALNIVAYCVPLVKRAVYTGFIGAMYGITSVAGLLLGGVFTDKGMNNCLGQRDKLLTFNNNLAMMFLYQPSPRRDYCNQRKSIANSGWKARIRAFDLQGILVFIPAIICLLLTLQSGGTKHPWGNWRIILLFLFLGPLIAGFIGIQFWKQDQASTFSICQPMKILFTGSHQ
ncbi:hypothetical protein N7449_001679, partial [Penicillium cf. viridicatum]